MLKQFISLALLIVVSHLGQAETLSVTTWGGEYSDSQRKAYFEPFMSETGHVLVEDRWGGDVARIRAMVERQHYTTTVLDAEGDEVESGCEEGILEVIDYTRLQTSPDDFLPGAAHKCGVGTIAWSMLFAYDKTDFVGDGPQNWQDFWDVERFPGKRGLYRGPETNIEIALLADGVAPEKVYDELRRPEGLDRAFRKLEQLKPHVIWWEAGHQAVQLLLDGAVNLTSSWNGRLHRVAADKNSYIQMVWDGQLLYFDFWIIPRGHPNQSLAYEFIDFASRPERQISMAHLIPYGPVLKEWERHADAKSITDLPTSRENFFRSLRVQPDYWNEHRAQLERRFAMWITR